MRPADVAAESLSVTLTNPPAAANRAVVVVDGGPIVGALRGSQDFPAGGMGPIVLPLGVPAGGPYRIRAIVFARGGIFPVVLRTGKVTGITISSGGSAGATIQLGDVGGSVDPSTPASADPGSRVTIKVTIRDPGDFLAGALSTTGRIFTSTTPPGPSTTSLSGPQISGPLSRLDDGLYSLTVSVNMPATATTLYFHFAESSFPFTESGQEAPFLYWPSLQIGGRPWQIVPTGTPAITAIDPSSTVAGSAGFTLSVSGAGFLQNAVVQWSGAALPTTVGNGSQLRAFVEAELIATARTVAVTVANPNGAVSSPISFTIAPAPLSIATSSPLPSGTVGTAYSHSVATTGGVGPYTWSVQSGTLPPGLSLNPSSPRSTTASLAGTPTTPGQFTFALRVADGASSVATKAYEVTINSSGISISPSGIVNAASYTGGAVAPGEIVTIFGSGVGPEKLETMQLDARGFVPTTLAGAKVLFGGVEAPIVYTQTGATSVVVPYEVSAASAVPVTVVYDGHASNTVSVPVVVSAPGIFTLDASGRGPGAVINADGSINSAAHPARPGSFLTLFATGEGETEPAGVNGKPARTPLPVPLAQPVTASIGGVPCEVLYAGGAPGLVSGVLQVNIHVPENAPLGSSVPISITVAGRSSQPNVTVAVGR